MDFRLLGRLEVAGDDGSVVRLSGALARAVVGRLLLAGGRPVRRDTLIDELWHDREAKNPVNALQVQMTKLRGAFAAVGEERRLVTDAGGYRLLLEPDDHLDADDFEECVRQGRAHLSAEAYEQAEERLRCGLSLWRGSALEDLAGGPFETERIRLEELRLAAGEDAIEAGLGLGRAEDLVPELAALLAGSPLRERPRSQLMLALYRCGRHAEALEVFDKGRRLLASELGLDPSAEMRSLHAAILEQAPHLMSARQEAAPAPVHRPEGRTTPPEGNLTRSVGPFVGRRTDLEALRGRIARESLVTVVGPGGVGKTRLTLEALSLPEVTHDGTWWVDLAAIDKAGVPAAVAATLGLSDAAVRPDQRPHDLLRRLTSFLGERDLILVLDNCEHVLDAAASLVVELLTRCRRLKVVTTSREPLAVPGEVLYPLAPMAPEEAAELFIVRAAMINPSFETDDITRQEVVTLCRRLDGIPLAVELAAAHARMLPVREITARLDNRFALLVKGERTAPARHKTLRAVLDWSYELLAPSERMVLCELALRIGGCSLAEIEGAGLARPGEDRVSLFQLVTRLVDTSLVVTVSGRSGIRLHMLETVREYALDRLREGGRGPEAEHRFTAWALRFTRECFKGLSSKDQIAWTERIDEETANLRAAADLLIRERMTADSLLLEVRLGYFWFISGREEEGIERLKRSLAAYEDTAAERQGERGHEEEWAVFDTFAWLAWLHHVAGRYEEARSYGRRFGLSWRHAKNPDLAALGPVNDTLYARIDADEDATELFTLAEERIVKTEFHWDRAVLHTNWSSYCLQAGDVEGARRQGLIAVEASQAADDAFALAWSLVVCGDAEETDGGWSRARAQWDEAARIFRPVGARTRWAYVSLRLACLDIVDGALASAEQRLAEVEQLAVDLSAEDLLAATHNLRGLLAARDHRFAEAEKLFRAVRDSAEAPPHRKAVACVGLSAHAASPDALSPGDARSWLRQAVEIHDSLLEPLARRTVGIMLAELRDRMEAGRTDEFSLPTRLTRTPSVLAAFY
ncbi:BTAD domain-containing putative transcriptional regulator [Streptomyces sp. NPDC050804]|uniref:AfsR/SARP family transcriptional regulator n=1 Tax=Streptomyces sp. NPDC050804 TaxID=3154745 RepID=UPI0034316111